MATEMEAERSFFQSIPWCAKILADPDFIVTPTPSRQYKATTEDAIFAVTLKAEDTIGSFLSLYKKPSLDAPRIDEVRALLTLGNHLNGYPHVCHGGVVATIIDEVMGILLSLNKDLRNGLIREATVTAYLKVSYLKPVATPQTVLARAQIDDTNGRKYFLSATIEDENAVILVKAEALWMGLGKPKEKL